ncbi:MAG: hypothetical protein Q9179_006251 [Wetmoreana sp. 5 TL-2023]
MDGDRPLQDPPTFKLLNILPSAPLKKETSAEANAIDCELLVQPLADAPEYEALSYTWGSTTQDWPIRIHTKQPVGLSSPTSRTDIVLVTKHLHAAILRLRQPIVALLVWIDQLCIDQNDIAERNAQVRLMAEIYRRAKRTVVWLGEGTILTEDEEAIKNAANRMSFRPVVHEYSVVEDQVILKELIGFRAASEVLYVGNRRRQAFAELLNRPWFTRAWVFQEVVVAKRGVVLCGTLELDLEVFINLLDGICEIDLQDVGEEKSIMHASKGYKPMFAIREARFEERHGLSSPRKSKWLSTLWQGMGNLKATDERDKVYAFLAFADSEQEARIAPSYEKPVESVYTDAAFRSIRKVGSLDVLELAIKNGASSIPLPSWTPDFSNPLPSLPFMTHNVGSTEFKASRGLPYPFLTALTPESGKLDVSGHVISTVKSMSPKGIPDYKPFTTLHDSTRLADLTTWVSSQIQPVNQSQDSKRDLETRILRTLLAEGAGRDDTPANLNYDASLALEVYQNESMLLRYEAKGMFRDKPSRTLDGQVLWDQRAQNRYRRWMTTISEIMDHKRFLLSEHNDFGLAYEAMREGDLICILFGSKTPTILRRVSDTCHRFIAQCYIDGWMRGEEHGGREWTEADAKTFVLI